MAFFMVFQQGTPRFHLAAGPQIMQLSLMTGTKEAERTKKQSFPEFSITLSLTNSYQAPKRLWGYTTKETQQLGKSVNLETGEGWACMCEDRPLQCRVANIMRSRPRDGGSPGRGLHLLWEERGGFSENTLSE